MYLQALCDSVKTAQWMETESIEEEYSSNPPSDTERIP